MGHLYQNWLFIYWTKAIAVAALGAAASTSSINLGWYCKEWTSETVCRSTKRIAFMNGFERRSVALTCDKDARLLKWLDPSRTPFSNEFKRDLHKLWVCFKTGYTIVYFQKSRIFEYPIENDARTEATNRKTLLWFGVWEAFFFWIGSFQRSMLGGVIRTNQSDLYFQRICVFTIRVDAPKDDGVSGALKPPMYII